MKRLLCLAALPLLFAAAPTPAPIPDVPFVGDFIRMQSNTVALLRTVHRNVKDKSVVQRFDDAYYNLATSVNGLFDSVAFDVEHNTPHDADWQKAAAETLDQANQLRLSLHAIADGRRQAAYRGIPGSASIEWDRKQKSLLVKYDVDFTKAQQDASQAKLDAFKAQLDAQTKSEEAAQSARKQFAADLKTQKWPALCAVGLEHPACPADQKA